MSSVTRLTTDQHNLNPIWTPDGTRVWFYRHAVSQATNGSPCQCGHPRWRPDATLVVTRRSHLLFSSTAPETSSDIWQLSLDRKDSPSPLLVRSFDDFDAVFSPDGRWTAYVSNESGRPEILVAPYPRLEEKIAISSAGGTSPVWARDGRELFIVKVWPSWVYQST